MKAIETRYNGYRFRSRLEARWAVYFDALGIKYEYEKEGFDLDGIRYLPDFWLPEVQMWAEVKPVEFTEEEKEKCKRLVEHSGFVCLLLDGPPGCRTYTGIGEDCLYGNGDDDGNPVPARNLSTEYWLTTIVLNENRFWFAEEPGKDGDFFSDDVRIGVVASKSARFEFGEKG